MEKSCPGCEEQMKKIGEFKVPASLPIPIIDIPNEAKGEPLELFACPNCGMTVLWGVPEVIQKIEEEE